MKSLILFLAIAGCIAFPVYGQPGNPAKTIDTVTTVDYGKMPPVYFSNKVYWERNYDKNNHLLFEGLKYNACFIGDFIEYWPNGQVKTKGQYLRNKTGDWTDLVKRGLCSMKDSTWKYYNENGRLIGDYIYAKGIIITRNLP